MKMRRVLRLSIGAGDRARDIERELGLHIELLVEELIASGVPAAEARTRAEHAFGNLEAISTQCSRIRRARDRDRRKRSLMDAIWQDARYGLRVLMRSPGFTVIALFTLALGIGANTAVFSVLNAVLLRPLPYSEPDRVVVLRNHWQGEDDADVSPAEFLDYADQRGAFAAVGAYSVGWANLLGADQPERVLAAEVTPGVFPALGAVAARGRLFSAQEGLPGRDQLAVLSHAYWVMRFGAQENAIGQTLTVDGRTVTVIGVLSAEFVLPTDLDEARPADVFLPFGFERATSPERGSHFLDVVARLANGVKLEQAQTIVSRVAADFMRLFPNDYPADMRFGVRVIPAHAAVVDAVRPLLVILGFAVAFVLLVACTNVASLMLVRAEGRRRELALRAALGAGRWQLARQLLTENLVLAGLGGALGLAFAWVGTHALTALQPGDIPRFQSIGVDGRVVGFALLLSLASAVLFGTGPAVLTRIRLEALREGGPRATSSRASVALRRALVGAEVALAVVLLVGAGLMVRSFVRLVSVDPGYRTEQLLTFGMSLPVAEYDTNEKRRAFYSRLTEQLAALPGVHAAGGAFNLPLASGLGDINIRIEGREVRESEVSPKLDWQVVTPGWFDAMGIPVLRGRGLTSNDDERAPGAVVLSEAAARLHFSGVDPLGKRFVLGGQAGPGWVTVVGIARDIRHASFAEPPRPIMYLAHRQFHFWHGGMAPSNLTIVLQIASDPSSYSGAVREIVRRLDRNVPLSDFRTMDQIASESVAEPRFALSLLGFFASASLVLAVVGIYGLIAYTVARRRRELGVRIALGARAGELLRLVIVQGMQPIVVGIAVGTLAALALTRTLGAMLYEVAPRDPATFIAVIAGLGLSALAACGVPALRAARVDPIRALKEE